jgi:hypothetical protein
MHGEHRAFARLGNGLARLGSTEVRRCGQRTHCQSALSGQTLADSLQKLGEYRARIASRRVDGFAGHTFEDRADMPSRHRPYGVSYAGQGETEIAASVAVRDRKHVDAVQHVAFGENTTDAGDEGLLECASVGFMMHVRRGCRSCAGGHADRLGTEEKRTGVSTAACPTRSCGRRSRMEACCPRFINVRRRGGIRVRRRHADAGAPANHVARQHGTHPLRARRIA